jgi:hypothetical protein
MADIGRISSPARGIIEAMYSVCSRLIASSWSPSTTNTGAVIASSCASVQFGWLAHILLICSTKASYHDHGMVRRQRLYLVAPVVRVCQASM